MEAGSASVTGATVPVNTAGVDAAATVTFTGMAPLTSAPMA